MVRYPDFSLIGWLIETKFQIYPQKANLELEQWYKFPSSGANFGHKFESIRIVYKTTFINVKY